jgi:hypothetical protein
MQCDRCVQLCRDNFTLAIECTANIEEQPLVGCSRLWRLLTREKLCRTQSVLLSDGVRVYSVAVPRDGKIHYGFLLLVFFISNSNHCISERGARGDDRTSLVITGDSNHQRFTCANHDSNTPAAARVHLRARVPGPRISISFMIYYATRWPTADRCSRSRAWMWIRILS